ncbi:MAG: aspartate--ammonia ligase [Bacteroidetes bacterium]|uniref:Aspartate--ammonia ligase n=1 Tax=Candidatus Cryptobacteroides merdigallinarum TaxID=2840770 RepID=A0A9D9EJL3_9BACT|nr:aspartate--ammonia ligase [Candidatus Cryptobacteroides merdigallinarum]
MSLILPEGYRNVLENVENTEKAIKYVKDMFQENLSAQLALLRVTAPMVVLSGTGINDDLNSVERPVAFPVKSMGDTRAEVVHSLAKWKRLKLAEMGVGPGRGIYTDMNALRPDEDLDNLHSIYVDQWDWEKVISREDRNITFLKSTVRRIYEAIKVTENKVFVEFPQIVPVLPEDIFFIHSEELLQLYPDLTPKERETEIVRRHKAVFVIGIGGDLSDGKPHDGRAADYDDWSTVDSYGFGGLNGDILLWNPVLQCAFEVSSMGIRVDEAALERQLAIRHQEWKKDLYFHRRLLAGELPCTIGGGIGQSRLCMYLLRKAHVGEIQSSIWPEDMAAACREHGIELV